jgi:hypothetical protein
LRKLGTRDLAALAERGASEKAQVIEELAHRTSRAARRLLAELSSNGASGTSRAPGRAARPESKVERPPADRPRSRAHTGPAADNHRGAAGESEPRPDGVDRDLQTRFDLLRATFTVEGEILARWGMTEEMPAEIEASVVEQWRVHLSSAPDHRGRTLTTLDMDMRSLAAERAQGDAQAGGSARVG